MMIQSPENVVNRQLEAYNARDIEQFMATWHSQAQYWEYPQSMLADGASQIRERHVERFKDESLHGKLFSRTVMGHLVIDHEIVTRRFDEGVGEIEVIAIYQVHNELITDARFSFGKISL